MKFACGANYILEGSKIITCGETKEWSSTAPSCLAPCLDPGEPGNGIRIRNDFKHGKSIKLYVMTTLNVLGKKPSNVWMENGVTRYHSVKKSRAEIQEHQNMEGKQMSSKTLLSEEQ